MTDILDSIEGYLRRRGYDEDARQEGLVAAWLALQSHPGQSDGYYARAARNGALSFLLGKKLTGSDRRGLRRNGGERALIPADTTDDFVVSLFGAADDDDIALRLAIDSALVELDVEDEIYVRVRFFEGFTHVQAVEASGVSYTAWSDRIRPRLARELADVVG